MDIFGFVDHLVSAATTQLFCYTAKTTGDGMGVAVFRSNFIHKSRRWTNLIWFMSCSLLTLGVGLRKHCQDPHHFYNSTVWFSKWSQCMSFPPLLPPPPPNPYSRHLSVSSPVKPVYPLTSGSAPHLRQGYSGASPQ